MERIKAFWGLDALTSTERIEKRRRTVVNSQEGGGKPYGVKAASTVWGLRGGALVSSIIIKRDVRGLHKKMLST